MPLTRGTDARADGAAPPGRVRARRATWPAARRIALARCALAIVLCACLPWPAAATPLDSSARSRPASRHAIAGAPRVSAAPSRSVRTPASAHSRGRRVWRWAVAGAVVAAGAAAVVLIGRDGRDAATGTLTIDIPLP